MSILVVWTGRLSKYFKMSLIEVGNFLPHDNIEISEICFSPSKGYILWRENTGRR